MNKPLMERKPLKEVLLKTCALSKSFQSGSEKLEVLKEINFTLYSGELLGIIGVSGSGKSTLLNLLGGISRPDSGTIFCNGVDISGMDRNDLARYRNKNVGFIFQFHHLLPEFSAAENVMMPLLVRGVSGRNAFPIARKLLDRLGLASRLTHKPAELSGGEQQRVAVARAIVTKPSLILADEPTGNLDEETGKRVFELFLELREEYSIATVLATHNESLAGRCDRVLRLTATGFEKVSYV